ncbi:hypothetical protein B2J93_6519 [Marssonina coronariae]|uniref:Uncharacterized protein n=1 Tax=Diplocarpon coronariae TaxID=2795749 RepID=A0A218Z1A6_9HELO|nr:hypothetical protein B2J93_6519 [Marssonina coronariae]
MPSSWLILARSPPTPRHPDLRHWPSYDTCCRRLPAGQRSIADSRTRLPDVSAPSEGSRTIPLGAGQTDAAWKHIRLQPCEPAGNPACGHGACWAYGSGGYTHVCAGSLAAGGHEGASCCPPTANSWESSLLGVMAPPSSWADAPRGPRSASLLVRHSLPREETVDTHPTYLQSRETDLPSPARCRGQIQLPPDQRRGANEAFGQGRATGTVRSRAMLESGGRRRPASVREDGMPAAVQNPACGRPRSFAAPGGSLAREQRARSREQFARPLPRASEAPFLRCFARMEGVYCFSVP